MVIGRKTTLSLRFIALAYLGILVAVPVILIFFRTFEDGFGAFWDSITTPAAISALSLSLLIVAIVVPVNVIFGVVTALALVRGRFRGRGIVLFGGGAGELRAVAAGEEVGRGVAARGAEAFGVRRIAAKFFGREARGGDAVHAVEMVAHRRRQLDIEGVERGGVGVFGRAQRGEARGGRQAGRGAKRATRGGAPTQADEESRRGGEDGDEREDARRTHGEFEVLRKLGVARVLGAERGEDAQRKGLGDDRARREIGRAHV
jgi:hypothetical protein